MFTYVQKMLYLSHRFTYLYNYYDGECVKNICVYCICIIDLCSMLVSDKRYLKTWRMAGIVRVNVYSNFSGYDSVP